MTKKDNKKSKIAILGFGVEGQALLKFLSYDKSNFITVCDIKTRNELEKTIPKLSTFTRQANFSLGHNYLDNIDQFDIIYRSPGIPINIKEIQQAKRQGVKISSATKLFFELFQGTIIGITGTKGKSTTSMLVYKILKANKKKVLLGGNIGTSLLLKLRKLGKQTKNYIAVLELSSFQLQDLEKSPRVAVFLNFSPDHLNYHKNLEEYFQAKIKIVSYQQNKDYVVLNSDDIKVVKAAQLTLAKKYYFSSAQEVTQGAFIRNNKIIFKQAVEIEIMDISQIKLIGSHNLGNILAAITVTMFFKPNIVKLRRVIRSFKGLPYRLEFIAEVGSVKYYNDSAGTDTIATIAAIASFNTPAIFILGGSSKGENYSNLGMAIIKHRIKGVVLIGQTADEIKEAILNAYQANQDKGLPIILKTDQKDMASIVSIARSISAPGDSIVLSPASASFGMFNNYKERGNCFKQAVKEL